MKCSSDPSLAHDHAEAIHRALTMWITGAGIQNIWGHKMQVIGELVTLMEQERRDNATEG